mmetsp:Transcript_72867/g.128711  ORF Transcript_72867/g.128711 Transcript_72867/m.128711 type:complete len:133 (-) Transcript_72867:640-1038(-)|eukprot:CAMPEP_0197680296 /NCGR_PEP_ID=MMETSP1338-20131121/93100_1 /TAXON_ID=43686 ORGANISM="Pelagodinium beii, Strain RCC1491" /NCGR_SAMPLE_ID=MMETSP1338 /ASSEMBLY_ACC=CAM_ASM_000754 /LENGTH=132 /DNA_ID=CAMNT_0043261455 /DNA_START=101 /DNA_END=499 /DNA_ORIENTATION=-
MKAVDVDVVVTASVVLLLSVAMVVSGVLLSPVDTVGVVVSRISVLDFVVVIMVLLAAVVVDEGIAAVDDPMPDAVDEAEAEVVPVPEEVLAVEVDRDIESVDEVDSMVVELAMLLEEALSVVEETMSLEVAE